MSGDKFRHYYPGVEFNWPSESDYTTLEVIDGPKPAQAEFDALPWPVVRVPEFVTRAQAKIALARAGLYEQVVGIIAAAPLEAQIWWSEADTFRRDNQWVDTIGALLTPPLTSQQTDDLFINAETVVA